MTISKRIIMGFAFVIFTLFLFGLLSYYNMQRAIEIIHLDKEISNLRVGAINIQRYSENYRLNGHRESIIKIEDEITEMINIQNSVDFSDLSAEVGVLAHQLIGDVVMFEDKLEEYQIIKDQTIALSIDIEKQMNKVLSAIDEWQVTLDDEEAALLDFVLIDSLKLSIMQSHQLDNNSEYNQSEHLKLIENLESYGNQLKNELNDVQANVIGQRLFSMVLNASDFESKMKILTKEEMEYNLVVDKISNDIAYVSELTDSTLDQAEIDLTDSLKRLFIFAMTFTLITSFITVYWITNRIKRSFSEIHQTTAAIEQGDYSVRLKEQTDSDLNLLVDYINRMAGALEKSHKEIVSYNETLEDMVNKKTTELHSANQKLERFNEKLTLEKERLAVAAMTDYLTGLKNRGFVMEALALRINHSRRNLQTFCLLILDIDFFKAVNDTHGHQVGDDVLKIISEVILSVVRESDVVGRYGGEEFIVIFTDADLETANLIAERLRESVESTRFIQEDLRVTISGGIAQYRGERQDDFVKIADDLLYVAKANGRNRIEN